MARTLEVRRHSLRKSSGGSQLSQAGVAMARRLGADMGPFDLVVTSPAPRARETAVAMGFAVDHELARLTAEEDAYAELEAARHWEADRPMAALAALIARRGAAWRLGWASPISGATC